jgi:hypothetical protein
MWSGCLGDIEWGMCGVRDPLGNALKMVKKHIKSAEKSNNQNGWCGIKQSKSHKYHFPIPLVFRIKTIKIPEKSREMDNTDERSARDGQGNDKPPNGWAPRSPSSHFRTCFRLEISEPTLFIK